MNLTKHKTVIDAEDNEKNTIAKVVISTDGTYYQEELRAAIVKTMNKWYDNVFVEVKK